MAASHGFEPQYLVPETSVLPLDEKAIKTPLVAVLEVGLMGNVKQPQFAMKGFAAVG